MLTPPDSRTREALDLDRLLSILAGRTRTAAGRELVLGLTPLAPQRAQARAAAVGECRERLVLGAGGLAMPVSDPREWHAPLEGGVVRLDLPEMRNAAQCVEASEASRRELAGLDTLVFPLLHERGRGWPALEPLQQMFRRAFGADGELRDDASADLKRARQVLRQLDDELRRTVERLLKTLEPYLAEQFVTLRHDRYVFPVRAENHRKVQGLLHDQSGTGGTWFIEPYPVVELNNRRSEARLAEQAEVARILREMTDRLRGSLPELDRSLALLAEMDFFEALARTSRKWAARPALAASGARMRLVEARHPLLLEQRESAESVVPLSLEWPEGQAGLLITGPNMGGKTVILKTAGLLVFLAACGAHVPAAEGTELGEFRALWADIGDAQSLERDTSTFAAHLLRLDEILVSAGPGTLVLCDELGTGTDPSEGAALSRAFLERLAEKGARVLATSHLGALKLYAGGDSGYGNASMEFEAETFRPTYRLRLGVPGQSHALEMAQRLGCLKEVLGRARDLLGGGEQDSARLLGELTRLAEENQRALEESKAAAIRSEELQREMDRRVSGWEKEKVELRARTRAELEQLVDGAERWVLDLKDAARDKNREAMREAREKLEQNLTALRSPEAGGEAAQYAVGDRARIAQTRAIVEVLTEPGADGRLWVSNRGLRILVRPSDLEPVEPGLRETVPVRSVELASERAAGTEVDLRGCTVDEAIGRVEKAFDDALLTGVQEIRLIHGKGTGALRRGVQDWLKSSNLVRSQRLGNWNEGGLGVTVVDLDL